ncbi:T9SS type A sorting domain-containing protein [bacterium]|nr:T9SS type A sorting domain-containing protein [bacterium]
MSATQLSSIAVDSKTHSSFDVKRTAKAPSDNSVRNGAFCVFGKDCKMIIILLLAALLPMAVTGQPVLENLEYEGQWGYGVYTSVATQGDITGYGCGGSLRFFDTTNPEEPHQISTLTIPEVAFELIWSDSLIFFSTYSALYIADVSDIASPRILTRLYRQGGGRIELGDNILFETGSYDYALLAYDVRDPQNIAFLDSFMFEGRDFPNTAYKDGRLYVVVRDFGVKVLTCDFEQGFQELFEQQMDNISFHLLGLGDGFAVMGYNSQWRVLEITNDSIAQIGRIYDVGHLCGLSITDTLLYATTGEGLVVVDMSDLENPRLLSSIDTDRSLEEMALSEGFCYTFRRNERRTYSVQDPNQPELVNLTHDAGTMSGIVSYEAGLYVVCDEIVWSLSTERAGMPEALDSVNIFTDPRDFSPHVLLGLHEGVLYLDASEGIATVDVANPEDLRWIGLFECDIRSSQMAFHDTIGFLTTAYDILVSFDISDPSNIVPLDTLDLVGPWAVTVTEDYVFVGRSYVGGFQIVDASDPREMQLVSTFPMGAEVEYMFAEGDYAYLAMNGGLAILDISNPEEPNITGLCALPGERRLLWRLSKDGDFLYGSNTSGSGFIFNVADPTNPEIVASCTINSMTRGIAGFNGYMYLLETKTGVHVFRFEDENGEVEVEGYPSQAVGYFACAPNPFNNSCKISYELPFSTVVSIVLYDGTGRFVTEIFHQNQSAGYHDCLIEASDITAGVYFVKFSTDKFQQSLKLILIH